MQISSANTLIAAQQAKQTPQAKPAAKPFAEALARHSNDGGFAPLDFKQTAARTPATAETQTPAAKPGSQLDIRI